MLFQRSNLLRQFRLTFFARSKTRLVVCGCVAIGCLTLLLSLFVVSSARGQNDPERHKETVINTVARYANQWDARLDPLVTLPNGVELKSSHVNGVLVQGQRYYYRLRYGLNYDPVSRGGAVDYTVVAVLDPDTQWEMEIYRLPDNALLADQGSATLSSS